MRVWRSAVSDRLSTSKSDNCSAICSISLRADKFYYILCTTKSTTLTLGVGVLLASRYSTFIGMNELYIWNVYFIHTRLALYSS